MLLILSVLAGGGASRREKDAELSFEELYREHYGRILGFFRGKTGSSEESEDLAQDTFVRAYRRLAEFRGEAKVSTWLYTIAANVWINRLRDARAEKRKAEERDLEDGRAVADPREDPQEEATDRQARELLRAAIEDLPPKMQRCVWLRVYQERSFAEIALLEGVSESTAKSHVSRAAEQLRPRLAEHFPELLEDPESGG